MWGEWSVSGVGPVDPRIDTVAQPNHTKLAPPAGTVFPWSAPAKVKLAPHTAKVIEIDLTATVDPALPTPVKIQMTATKTGTADRVGHVASRLYSKHAADRAEFRGRNDRFSTIRPSGTTVPPSAVSDVLMLFLANTDGTETVDVEIELDLADEPGLVLSSFDGTIGAFDVDTLTAMDSCEGGAGGPDLGDTYRSDVERIYSPVTGYAVSYPYNHEVRVFDAEACSLHDTIELDPAGPGPAALDMAPDFDYLAIGAHDPLDPCAAGAIALVDLTELIVVASVEVPVGVGDVAIVEGPSGTEVLVTQPGHETECFSSWLRAVPLADLLAAGVGAPPGIVVNIPIGGSAVHLPTRLDTTSDRDWVAWTMRNPWGRIGLMRASDHTYTIFEPEDPVDAPWDMPEDVAVVDRGADLRVMFIYQWETILGDDPWVDCLDGVGACSAARWIDYNPTTGDAIFSGERTLPYSAASRFSASAEDGRAFVGHSNRTALTVMELGDGLDNFMIHEATPFLTLEPWPVSIWLFW